MCDLEHKYCIYKSNLDIMITSWKDKRTMTLAATIGNYEQVAYKNQKKPAQIISYSNNMRGVDKIDQRISSYENKITSKKWWKRV